MKKEFIVDSNSKGKRLDKFLKENLPEISRSQIIKLIDKGGVLINGDMKKPAFCLKDQDKIRITLEEEKNELKPFKLPVKIIYEDSDLIVVDKPAGLVVHPPQISYNKTLVNALLYLKKSLSSKDPLRPGIVHRLDKETSGVMVIAKNNYSQDNLVEQFKERKVKKEYRAIVWGEVKSDRINIEVPLIRDSKNRLKMKVGFLNAKTAKTKVEVIKRKRKSTYLRIWPITGRMHQIRVHLKFMGFPIIGDKKYGRKDGYEDLFLHAKTLSFHHPRGNKSLNFTSPLPERFKEVLEVIEED